MKNEHSMDTRTAKSQVGVNHCIHSPVHTIICPNVATRTELSEKTRSKRNRGQKINLLYKARHSQMLLVEHEPVILQELLHLLETQAKELLVSRRSGIGHANRPAAESR